jgi:hypothetical protein
MLTQSTSSVPIAAWTSQKLDEDKRWVFTLSPGDIAEIDAALAHAKARQANVPQLSREDFPLNKLQAKLQTMVEELEHGLGVVLLRGLPIERYSKSDAGMIYWGIGRHMGRAVAQNSSGDVLGHVFDLGKDPLKDPSARGYQSNFTLPFHSDSCDVVGLLCLRTAKQGGTSSIVSSRAIYERMRQDHPDLLQVLRDDFYFDARNEHTQGQSPYYTTPVFEEFQGKVFCRYVRGFIDSAQRFQEVPRLTELQVRAMNTFEALHQDPSMRFDMELHPGDMQFVNNYVVLHSRTEYQDFPEIDRKRHLLRLWLFTPGMGDVPESFKRRYRYSEQWQLHPREPVYDIAVLMNQTVH